MTLMPPQFTLYDSATSLVPHEKFQDDPKRRSRSCRRRDACSGRLSMIGLSLDKPLTSKPLIVKEFTLAPSPMGPPLAS